jgi:WD40 repeat protein
MDGQKRGRIWDVVGRKAIASLPALGAQVFQAAFSADGRRLALGLDNVVRIWDVPKGQWIGQPLLHRYHVRYVAFNPQGTAFVTVDNDHDVHVWETNTGKPLIPALRHDSGVLQVRFSPDGRLFLTAGTDNCARVWDAASGDPVTPPLKHNGSIFFAAFSADGKQFITAGYDRTTRMWAFLPHREREENFGKQLLAREDAKAPNARKLARLPNPNMVQVVDVKGKALGSPLWHSSKITHQEFSADGGRVVTTSDDNTARVWDAETGRLLLPRLQHRGIVWYAAFSPDGRWVITASEDRTARVWDVATGEPLTPPLRHPRPVKYAFFSADGKHALTFAGDQKWRSWDLTADERPVDTLILLSQVLAGAKIDPRHGLMALDGEALGVASRKLADLLQREPQ